MRYTLLISIVVLALAACKKDKFTTNPVLSYKSVKPNTIDGNLVSTGQVFPVITLHVTDAEGDLGFKDGSDTSYIYVKNLLANTTDSFKFPDLSSAREKNFQCDIEITPTTLFQAGPRPTPKTDTLYYEIYVKDIAKHKSNVIRTGDPIFYVFK
jgi:hypothetical protein